MAELYNVKDKARDLGKTWMIKEGGRSESLMLVNLTTGEPIGK